MNRFTLFTKERYLAAVYSNSSTNEPVIPINIPNPEVTRELVYFSLFQVLFWFSAGYLSSLVGSISNWRSLMEFSFNYDDSHRKTKIRLSRYRCTLNEPACDEKLYGRSNSCKETWCNNYRISYQGSSFSSYVVVQRPEFLLIMLLSKVHISLFKVWNIIEETSIFWLQINNMLKSFSRIF